MAIWESIVDMVSAEFAWVFFCVLITVGIALLIVIGEERERRNAQIKDGEINFKPKVKSSRRMKITTNGRHKKGKGSV